MNESGDSNRRSYSRSTVPGSTRLARNAGTRQAPVATARARDICALESIFSGALLSSGLPATGSLATVIAAGPGWHALEPEIRQKARLLSTFLLFMAAVFGASDAISVLTRPGYLPPWYGYVFLLSAALLNRAGRYLMAAALTLSMFPLVTLVSVLAGGEPGTAFSYLTIGVILSSILLNRQGATLFAASCFVWLLSTPVLIPDHVPSLRSILTPLVLVAIGGGLSIILILHREELETSRQNALRHSEERLQLALDASHLGIWDWDTVSGDAHWSDRVEALFGRPGSPMEGTTAGYVRGIHPEDRATVESAFAEVAAGRAPGFDLLHRVVRPDGSLRWIQIQGRSTPGPAAARRVNGTVLDVTDRKNAEAERDTLIRELEAKNAELERFTYTVSHDLKSPLITVRGFLGSIEKDIKDGRVDRLSVDIQRILNATGRMQKLLDELLNLSRIGRVADPPERVPFANLAREAMDLVRGRLDAARVRVEIQDDLPDVFGDRSRLVQVLQNLLDNAAKFVGEQKVPKIVIGTRPSASDGRPVFFVQDNGLGVEPGNVGRMVGLFEKLDERSGGTGVGLAIVKRIVEVHGGKLWVESKGLGTGTTVCFTLPTRAPV